MTPPLKDSNSSVRTYSLKKSKMKDPSNSLVDKNFEIKVTLGNPMLG